MSGYGESPGVTGRLSSVTFRRAKPVWIVLLSLLILCVSVRADISEVDYDTTRVRQTTPAKKSFGEAVADVPGEILKLPFRIVEVTIHTLVMNPPLSEAIELIEFGREVRPYIPIVGYGSRAGLKLGFGLRHAGLVSDDIARFKWYYSTNDYQSYQFTYDLPYKKPDAVAAGLYFRYKKRPRERFYGVGNASNESDRAGYTLEHTEFRVDVPVKIAGGNRVTLTAGYHITNLYDGRDPELETNLDTLMADPIYSLRSGHFDGTRQIRIGGQWLIDGRDSPTRPIRGFMVELSLSRFLGVGRSENWNYTKWSADVHQHFHLWRDRSLVLRARVERVVDEDTDERATPIYLLSQLGGLNTLRGYSRGRFLDDDLAYGSVEYRYPIYDFMDAFVFFEEGRVYTEVFEESFLKHWKYSTGFGLRFWTEDSLIAIVQAAGSRESVQVYLELGISF
jgi:outer membrane protein assembly factor BamA